MEDNTGCSATNKKPACHLPDDNNLYSACTLLSILESYEFTKGWIFSNFIQLYMNRDYKHNWGRFLFSSIRTKVFFRYIQMDSESENKTETVVKKMENSATDFAVDCIINSDNYVHTMLNYYYVPSSVRYKKIEFTS